MCTHNSARYPNHSVTAWLNARERESTRLVRALNRGLEVLSEPSLCIAVEQILPTMREVAHLIDSQRA